MSELQKQLELAKVEVNVIQQREYPNISKCIALDAIDAAIAEAAKVEKMLATTTKMANQVELGEKIRLQIRINRQQAAKCLTEAARLNKCLKEPI